ncbi:MAG: GntR family transcriptional regulator [Hyphomonas sp.]
MIASSALPKHVQLSEMLIREILAGHLVDGARLPPERRMAAELGVAVGTLRRALALLEEKGLLQRVQGSGNYISARANVESVYAFFRLELAEGGGLPTARVIEAVRRPKPPGAPDFGASPAAHRIRRVRLLDEVPVALEEIWLDTRFTERLKAEELMDSLYFYYKKSFGLVIARIEDRVTLRNVPDWAPKTFPMRPGAAAGYIERLSFAQDNQPAEYSRTWFHPVLARYTIRLQ